MTITPTEPVVAANVAPDTVPSDVKKAFDALTAKAKLYTAYFKYYDGDQPLRYSTTRLRDIFQDITARFTQNFCAVVIDAELERIHLDHFDMGKDTAVAERLKALFSSTGLDIDAADMRTAELVCGESFICAQYSPDGDEPREIEAYYNDPRLVHMFYESENPRRKRMAAKWWVGDDGLRYLNLYYPDRILYYVSTGKAESVQTADSFVPAELPEAQNEKGIIPIFHFRLDRRIIKSRLVNVTDPQDMINKLTADMMVASEFGAFAQRWAITEADISALKSAPNEVWKLPPGDGSGQPTSVGSFPVTNLDNFLSAIDNIAANIAIITRTPKHYLLSQGGDPSGEALIAMEAPLNKKAQATIDREKPVWSELASYLLLLDEQTVDAADIDPIFDKPATVQPMTAAQIRLTDTQAGISILTQLRDEGWTDEQLEQLEKDWQTQAALMPKSGATGGSTAPVEGSATTPSGAQDLHALYQTIGISSDSTPSTEATPVVP